ncbi:hypothetical protein N9B60_04745 [Mariniblastus sp.]|nr:hypothetical protein [Mariniblastus sp.]
MALYLNARIHRNNAAFDKPARELQSIARKTVGVNQGHKCAASRGTNLNLHETRELADRRLDAELNYPPAPRPSVADRGIMAAYPRKYGEMAM